MRIVKLTAENIKRLRAVEITPDGNTVVIAGRNGQGKTSVLDAIWMALGGGPAAKDTTRPIRDGATHAAVTVDLGELRVTRTWTTKGTTLRVESADGARFPSPQAMLDRLVGRLAFDPLDFAHQSPRDQLAALLDVVDLPFDPADLDQRRQRLYEQRTSVGREGKALEGQLAGHPEPPADLPEEEQSLAAVLDEYRRAQYQQADVEACRRRVGEERQRVERLRRDLAQAEADLEQAEQHLAQASTGDLADVPLDTYTRRLAELEGTNAAVRAARARADVARRLTAKRDEYQALTARIAELDDMKAAAIRDAAMPIDGLGFDSDGVTYNGVPFKQCSAAEQLRVSVAMAMALNPKVRVIRITDGSLLDSDNLALIEEMARDNDYQCWVERVSDGERGVGILIEDGTVVDREPAAS